MREIQSVAQIQREIDQITTRYRIEKVIGVGSYGVVLRARDSAFGDARCAIKRVNKEIFDEVILARRILRELKLLEHFNDTNIVGLRDVLAPDTLDFGCLYIVMDIMKTDLRQVLKVGQKLTDAHVQHFTYQILRALNVIHSAGVMHRDVTPANVLVNSNCDVKLCDFGLAKEENENGEPLTDYVTVRWYRAPELVMEHTKYTNKVDVWGVGCIMGELLGSRPLCQGKDRINQLDAIIELIGTPSEEEINSIGSPAAQKYLRGKQHRPGIDFAVKYPGASEQCLDLLRMLLRFHPDERITVLEAMRHPYLTTLFNKNDEHVEVAPFAFEPANYSTILDVKRAILRLCQDFKAKNASENTPFAAETDYSLLKTTQSARENSPPDMEAGRDSTSSSSRNDASSNRDGREA